MTSVNGKAAALLAGRLRDLREREWTDAGLTQARLARALSMQSRVASATLSSWENVNNPKTPTMARLNAYARFFATRRSLDGEPHLIAVDELDDDERDRFEQLEKELFQLHSALLESGASSEVDRRPLLLFDDPGPGGPIVILCPEAPEGSRGTLAEETDVNYTRLHRFADADALLEVYGHIRALNPDRSVLHRLPSDIRKSDLQNHLVILGGIGWNPMLRRIQAELTKKLPIEQVEDARLATGEVFRVRTEDGAEEHLHFPTTEVIEEATVLTEDISLIARLSNPFNSSRTLTILNGVHSTGVLGAVLALTDETVRAANEQYICSRFPKGDLAMLVKVPVVSGTVLAPDLQNPETRVFEWAPARSVVGG
jgi:transcriptional regulator with XRE-family HTH domain